MNIDKLCYGIDSIRYSGNTLSNEQRVILSNSLTILQAENHFVNVYLWGLILGQESDYYIAYGYQKDALFGRKFFYSTNMIDWGVLPIADELSKRFTEVCTLRFQGDPALVVEVVDDDPGPCPEEIEKKLMELCLAGGNVDDFKLDNTVGVGQLKEEDRLAATVEAINNDVVSIPRGVLIKDPEGRVHINTAYDGLPSGESNDLKSYVHYRKPVQKWNTNLIERKDYNFALDFLDTIDRDVPKGSWILQRERGGRLVILKNLMWPGFTSYHYINDREWGYFYYGNGKKDLDVPFMIYA